MSPIDFARSESSRAAGPGEGGFDLTARLESAGNSQLLRGIFPANRQSGFVNECFAVLDRPGLVRKPAPPTDLTQEKENKAKQNDQPEETKAQTATEKPAEAIVRQPDLLTDSQTQQPPCTVVELPREGTCYVAAVQKHLPLSAAEFRQSRPAVLNSLMSGQYEVLRRQWWNSNNIRQRTGYQEIEPNQDKQAEKEQG